MDKKRLTTAIQMYDFYLYDLKLYLDTHPDCPDGLAEFKKFKKLREEAYELYTSKYGPITADQSSCGRYFDWVNGPWPWERSAN